MNISIIIVNYNTPTLTLSCVESIYKTAPGVSFEIIVVDNESTDSGKDSLLDRYPKVVWIQNSYNAGFGRANNLGVKSASASVVLFLNSDTLFVEDSITACYTRMIKDKGVVAAGVQLLNADGSKQDSAYDIFYWTKLADGIPYAGWLLKYPFMLVKKMFQPLSTKEIGYLNGAFLMVKRQVLEQVGFFDEDFFLYAEETELCSRLRAQGDLMFYNDLNVYHLMHGSKANETYHYGQHQLSIQLLVRKKFGVIFYLAILFLHCIALILNLFISTAKSILFFNPIFLRKFKIYLLTFVMWVRFAPRIILRKAFLFRFSLPTDLAPSRND